MSALWTASEGDIINIGKGHPNPAYLPAEEISAAYVSVLNKSSRAKTLLQYSRMQGDLAVCEKLCSWLREKAYRKKITPENILVTTGGGPGLALACQLFSEKGDTIFVDSPYYFLSACTFKDNQLNIVEIPTDEHGINVDIIEDKLRNENLRPKLLYTVPICNNPTGTTMSDERRQRLVHLSREFGFKILADEVYQFLEWDSGTNPTQGFFDLDDPAHPTVFAINSFSKLMGPGLRVGWIETGKEHMDRILQCGSLQSGGGFNPITSGMVLELLNSGFVDRHVEMLRNKYQLCCTAMCESIDALGLDIKYYRPLGGFFMWLSLPKYNNNNSNIDTEKLLSKYCEKSFGVRYFAGRHFCNGDSKFDHCIRLCFAFLEPQDIKEGVRRLGLAIAAYIENEN